MSQQTGTLVELWLEVDSKRAAYEVLNGCKVSQPVFC